MTQVSTTRRRSLPSLSDVIFSSMLALMFLFGKGGGSLLGDSDTGWHIRTGEWILSHLSVPRQDLFSFSKPGGEWFAWEWLSDVALAAIHRFAGLGGVVLASGLLIAFLFTWLYRFMVRRGANVLAAAALALAAGYASSIHWLARPHLVSWVLVFAFYAILAQVDPGDRRIFWLIPLTVLWTNLHGSFVAGILLVALYAIGELVRAALAAGPETPARRAALQNAARYGRLAAVCTVASLANPYFYRVHVHILGYIKNEYILNHINEFSSPNFHAPAARFFEILLLVGIGTALWALRQRRYAEALILVVFSHLALQSARHIPLYAVLSAPIIAVALTDVLQPDRIAHLARWLRTWLVGFQRFAAGIGQIDRQPRFYLASALTVLMVTAVLRFPAVTGRADVFEARFDPKGFPVAAADFLMGTGFAGNIVSTDQWSSYLIYRAFPRIRVFMDGRSDYYGAKLGEKYLDLMAASHTWEQTLQDYGVECVLLPVDSGLVAALKESPRWKVDYDDGVAIVFHRTGSATAELMAAVHGAARAPEVRP